MDIEPRQGGFVKLSRHILDIPLSANSLAIYTYMLLKACYKDGAVAYGTTLSIGQLITKNKDIEEHYGLSPREVRSAISSLEKFGMITKKTTNKFTLITVCNYCNNDDENNNERQTRDKQETNKRQA